MGRGGTPSREISFVSLVACGHKVSHSALAMGVYSFLNQAGQFPTSPPFLFVKAIVVVKPVKPTICRLRTRSRENNLQIHRKAQIRIKTKTHTRAAMTQTCKFSPSNQFLGFSHCRLSWRVWNTFCLVKRLMSLSCSWSSSWS